ncbi:methyltransferase [Amylibacter ulvae]|uniref:Methyltransferase n=1 Tax=Paramylibacter ulvae TaxID=1651968 RepID=A0ABQ3D417_9RHOB|nr:class I SAM-dependent methyltransferase [Amylibacter ulvae]GHA56659.1 methyltransferase [Amylibacter ulvae]
MTDLETIQTYDQTAEQYQNLLTRHKPDADLTNFINAIPAGGHVLDLGCGPGNSGAFMAQSGLIVDATDASSEMVALAKKSYGLNAVQQEFHQLSAIKKYDGIWANFSLLHATKSEMPELLGKIHTALKPNAILHLGLLIGTGEQRESLGRFYAYYQTDEVNSLLVAANFTPTHLRTGVSTGMSGTEKPFMIVTARA